MHKILVLGKFYPPFDGGIEHVAKIFSEHMARHHSVRVIVSAHDGRHGVEQRRGVCVERLKTDAVLLSQPISFSLLWKMRLADYDMIHLHAPNPYAACVLWLNMLVSHFRGSLIIVHHMDIEGRRFVRWLLAPFYRRLVDRAAAVVVTSLKNFHASKDLPPSAPVVTLPLCVNANDYRIGAAEREAAQQWRRETYGDAPLIGFVGRHARYKGLDVLVRAVAAMPGVFAVIGGQGAYGELAMELARKLGVQDRIHFLGSLTHAEKLRMLAAIDVFAFPSTEITEAFGVTQLEAMLLGAVVVAGDLPTGVTDVAIDGQTALLARPGDAQHLAEQIRRVLDEPELAARLRKQALAHVQKNFSDSVVLSMLDQLIEASFDAERAVESSAP